MQHKKNTILIVEDSAAIAERIKFMLQPVHGISLILQAACFVQAREMMERQVPDMVLLDVALPDKSGVELLQFIKQKHNGTEVFMLSNHADEFYQTACKKMGAAGYFDKSRDFNLIPEVIAQTINNTAPL